MDGVLPLGTRMKGYEGAFDYALPWRMPMILRVDGRCFHTLTRKLNRPWDEKFIDAMLSSTIALCNEVEGTRLAYVQSDEISLLVIDYNKFASQPWFGKRVQKMVSIAAAIAATEFSCYEFVTSTAQFDARVFVLPENEVANYFVWRQQDAVRNSIQALAQSHFSYKSLHGLNQAKLQDKLMLEKGINWNDLDPIYKHGICVIDNEGWALD